MKRRILLLLSLVLTFSVFGFVGCGKDKEEETPQNEITVNEEDADKILEESINSEVYSYTLKDENFEDGKYYLYEIKENDTPVYPSIAVSKETGELVSVFSDNTVESYDNRYEEVENTIQKDWSGTYTKGNITLTLSKSDDTSFEFTISDTKNEFFGVAHGDSKEASYKDNEYNLKFELTEEGVKLTDDGKGGFSDLSGDYTRVE